MARYTLQDDPAVHKAIDAHLALIRQAVLERVRPQALLLAGSFGRGEGSVHRVGEEIRFYSDYEICVVSHSPTARVAVDQAGRALADRLPVSVSLFWNTPARIAHNRARNLSFGKALPTIGMYELKAGSQVLYGSIDLQRNQIHPGDLPTNEGIRLVENRMMEVIEAAGRGKPEPLAFATAKLILACGDAALLKIGRYHFSYNERAKRFAEHDAGVIAAHLPPWFTRCYRMAVQWKLRPFEDLSPHDLTSALPSASAASQAVLRWLLDCPGAPTEQLAASAAKAFPVLYHSGLMREIDPWYENAILTLRALRARRRIDLARIPPGDPPLTAFQALYGAIPLLFWSLPETQPADPALYARAADWLAWAGCSKGAERAELTRLALDFWHIFG